MNLTTKQKESLLFKRDLQELLTDFELSNPSRTAEEITEITEYKQYLRDLPDNDYVWKQAPTFYKTSRVYNILVHLYDKFDGGRK
jgi:hypothetical protein